MTTPQNTAWWEKEPYMIENGPFADENDGETFEIEYNIPAIISQARRMAIEECIEALDRPCDCNPLNKSPMTQHEDGHEVGVRHAIDRLQSL